MPDMKPAELADAARHVERAHDTGRHIVHPSLYVPLAGWLLHEATCAIAQERAPDSYAAATAAALLALAAPPAELPATTSTFSSATLTVTVDAPDQPHATRWAGHLAEHLVAEFGDSMRLHTRLTTPDPASEPSAALQPSPTSDTVAAFVDRLLRAEALLSDALRLGEVTHAHPIQGGHDSLGDDRACLGCELHSRIRTHLNATENRT